MVDKSEKFSWLVRVGYFSRAVFYGVIGLVALTNAKRFARGTGAIFEAIEQKPLGVVVLWIMIVGLVAYALFRCCSPIFDIENSGSDAKGWAKRIGHVGSAIGHLVLAWTAFQLATGGGSGAGTGSGGGAHQAAAGVLSIPLGGVVLGVLGLMFFATALSQAKKGITGEFMNRISSRAPHAMRWLGLAGYCARAVVYAVIGWSLFSAGFLAHGANRVDTLGAALADLAGQGLLFTVTAVGLLLFGVFSLMLAWYRIIPDLGEQERAPAFRSS